MFSSHPTVGEIIVLSSCLFGLWCALLLYAGLIHADLKAIAPHPTKLKTSSTIPATTLSSRHTTAQKIIILCSCLYGLWFGVLCYAAPNHFFGPNGLFPVYGKTSLESNDLDPITTNYLRMFGAMTITLILSYILFALGDLERERAMLKSFLAGHVASIIVCLRTCILNDFGDGYFLQGPIMTMLSSGILHIVWLASTLRSFPKSSEVKTATLDPVDHSFMIIYTGYFCLERFVKGPSHIFYPTTPLENNEFDILMIDAAQTFGAWAVPILFFLLTDARRQPTLIYKMQVMFNLLGLPVLFHEIHSSSEYSNQKAFIGLAVFCIFCMLLGFSRLGAFGKEYKTPRLGAFHKEYETPKQVKASMAA